MALRIESSVGKVDLGLVNFRGKFGVIKIHSAVDFLQISADCLSIFVRNKLAAVANLMDYAKLIFCLRENRVYRITKPREVIVAGKPDPV